MSLDPRDLHPDNFVFLHMLHLQNWHRDSCSQRTTSIAVRMRFDWEGLLARFRLGLFVPIACLVLRNSLHAATFYVSPFGNDANDGLARISALRSLAAAEALASPGDTIALRRGGVWRESIGSAVVGLNFTAYGEGPRPAIDATERVDSWQDLGGGVFSASVPIQTTSQSYGVMAFDDGVLLRRVQTAVECETTPGTYFAPTNALTSPVDVMIHLNDGSDPNANARSLRVSVRQAAIRNAAAIEGIYVRGAMLNNGGLEAWNGQDGGTITDSEAYGGGKHHGFAQHFSDVLVGDALSVYSAGFSGGLVNFRNEAAGYHGTFADCTVVQQNGDVLGPNFAAFAVHDASGPSFETIAFQRTRTYGQFGVGYGGGIVTTVEGGTHRKAHTVFSVGSDSTTFSGRDLQVEFAASGGASRLQATGSSALDNCFFVVDATVNNNVELLRYSGSLALSNCTFAVVDNGGGFGRPVMLNNPAGSELAVHRSVFVGRSPNTYQIDALGESYTGDFNIFCARSSTGTGADLRCRFGATIYNTLAAWQSATGEDAHSVYLTPAQLSQFWLGDPLTGDFRINPLAQVTGGDGSVYVGTFADGITPLTSAGAQVTSDLAASWAEITMPRILTAEGSWDGGDLADFNDDGLVDAVDLATWQSRFGMGIPATLADGDANFDQAVSGSDFLLWQRHFISQYSAVFADATSVPEPDSIFLMAITLGLLGRSRRGQTASYAMAK
ncbi:MAG: hypothetical protein KF847_19445 [Pirellulales bacterium]|nr:hypothetical protein [Pirellulales bacterium]